MARVLTQAVGKLALRPSAPGLLQKASSAFHFTPPISFSANIRGQPVFLRIPPRPITSVAYAAQTTIRCSKSAEKRHRQSEKRRVLNKARKNEVKTRMKTVLRTLDRYKKNVPKEFNDLNPVNPLMSAAFRAIDKAVKRGVLHRNTGKRRKDRLSRARRQILLDAKLVKPRKPQKVPSLVEAYEARKKAKQEAVAKLIAEKIREKEEAEAQLESIE